MIRLKTVFAAIMVQHITSDRNAKSAVIGCHRKEGQTQGITKLSDFLLIFTIYESPFKCGKNGIRPLEA
jgi:hypothetical protein